MKRYLAVLLCAVMLLSATPLVSADSGYNDDQFEWGEYACPHTHTEEVAEVPSTCLEPGLSGYIRCADCKLLLSGVKETLPLGDHVYDHACDTDCNVCGDVRAITHAYNAVVTNPDCENSGYTVHTCTVCGDNYVDGRMDALGHNHQVTETVDATCVADGKKVYTCTRCGDNYTEVIPATGQHTYEYICDEVCDVCGFVRKDAHVYTFMGTVEPTCGEDGSDGYKCWECGEYMYVIIPATGKHSYSGECDTACNVCDYNRESVVAHNYVLTEDVAVTCTTDGKQVYTCQGCGDSYTETISAAGHKYHIVITAPDCENGGYTTHTCTACGDVCIDNRTDALGHAYKAVVTAPDCENSGYTTYTCQRCDDSYVADKTEAVGHEYVPLSAEPATCETDGFETYYCQTCSDRYTVTIPALGHDYKAVVTAPDCENSGYTVHTCTVCGDNYVDGRVDSLGHNYQVTETVDATCVADGKKVYACTRCGDSYTEVIPATGQHTYEYICDEVCDVCGFVRKDAHVYTYMGTVDPTCGEDGSDGYKCWECGEYMYVIIPATGKHSYSGECDAACNVCGYTRESVVAHNYVLTEDVAVTCTTDGKQVYTCQGCGDSYTETISAAGHKYHIVITAPDCENGGYTTHTCTVCGDVCVDNRTDALGHAYTAVVTDPDCENGGYTTYTCQRCGDSYVADHTSALGHSYDDDKDADCNTCGYIRPVTQFGDANGDGKINNRDLGLLQQFVNGWEVVMDEAAADVTGDGKVNNRDLGLLQQYVNGWDVELG